jgi:hypothetical protein
MREFPGERAGRGRMPVVDGQVFFQIPGQPLRLAPVEFFSDKFPLQGSGRITP